MLMSNPPRFIYDNTRNIPKKETQKATLIHLTSFVDILYLLLVFVVFSE